MHFKDKNFPCKTFRWEKKKENDRHNNKKTINILEYHIVFNSHFSKWIPADDDSYGDKLIWEVKMDGLITELKTRPLWHHHVNSWQKRIELEMIICPWAVFHRTLRSIKWKLYFSTDTFCVYTGLRLKVLKECLLIKMIKKIVRKLLYFLKFYYNSVSCWLCIV